ncbi:MAG: two-component system sensor histidine kinase/response regulator [Myxococcota bacterium]|jgi:two-component system sensor histidine kinase/response regulator
MQWMDTARSRTGQVIDRFVGTDLSVDELRRGRVTVGFGFLAGSLAMAATLVNLLSTAGPSVAIFNLITAGALLLVPPIARRSVLAGSVYLNLVLLVLLGITAVLRGGLASVTIGWYPIVVMLARLTLPPRLAFAAAIAWGASLYPHAAAVDLDRWDDALGSPWNYATIRALICLGAFYVAGVFDHFTSLALAALEVKNHELAEARAREAEASTAKSRFLSIMSHEIRTPLTTVLGMSEMLGTTNLEADQRQYVEHIRTQGSTLLILINDVMDYSRLDANMSTTTTEPFDLLEAVESALEVAVMAAADKGLWLAIHYDPALGRLRLGDRGRVQQILNNLIGNAVKFTEHGGVTMSVDAHGDDAVASAVVDSGIGIPENRLAAVFGEFVQAEDDTARRYAGSGLGLAISQRLARLMAGELTVESVLEQGSTFRLVLPLPPAADGSEPDEPDRTGMSVIVAGSQQKPREVLVEELARRGVRCVGVATESELVQACMNAEKDVCVLVGHPLSSAPIEALIEYRTRTNQYFILCGSPGVIGPERAEQAGYDGFLAQPVRLSVLLAMLEQSRGETGTPAFSTRFASSSPVDPGDVGSPVGDPEKGSILLAEDNDINRMIAAKFLSQQGYRVDVAADGNEAVAMANDVQYRVILMDCQMPHCDGYEATRTIRSGDGPNATTPILALTAHALPGDRERCFAAGMSDYLTKPFDFEKITGRIEQWTNADVGRLPPHHSGGV